MVGEVREYDELAGIYEKLDTVRITTSCHVTTPHKHVCEDETSACKVFNTGKTPDH